MNKYFIFLFAILSVLSEKAVSQDTVRMTIAEARSYAMEHNKMMRNADLEIKKSQAATREAISSGLPQINASADYSNFLGAKMSFRFSDAMPAQEIEFKPQSNFSLNVSQLIFNGQYWVGFRISKLAVSLSEMNRQKSELDILSQVTEAYHLVLISEELLKKMNANGKNLNDLYEKNKAVESVGIIESTDLEQLSVQVNTIKNAIKSLERQLELAKNMLRLQIGIDVNTPIKLSTALEELINNNELQSILDTAFDVEENINMQLMKQQELVTEKMVNLKKASVLPTLSAFYKYNYKILKPDFDMSPAHVVGLQLNIPIFSGLKRSAQISQAKIDLEKVNNTKTLLSDQLNTQAKQLKFNYKNALETYTNQKENVQTARRVYANLKKKYEQGMLSGLDLINADNNYVKAETDLISATLSLLSAKLQLKKLYGITN